MDSNSKLILFEFVFNHSCVRRAKAQPQQKKCQKCLGVGHYTYECNREAKYLYRPSRTKIMANPSLAPKPLAVAER
jgi:hypothetical protein